MKIKKILWITLIILGVLLAVGVVFSLTKEELPVRLITDYSMSQIWEEGVTMHECAECHETEEFHSCDVCHDEHGSVTLPEMHFYTMIELTGDIDEVIFIPSNHFFAYEDLPNTFLTVDQFMEKWEIKQYASFTLYTRDGEFVRIERDNVTENAKFLPYQDGIRFASEDLHISTWAKGIARIIIVGEEMPLQINGQATSIGRLLLGKTTAISIEEAKVMFVSEEDGETREAYSSSRIEGSALKDLVDLTELEDEILFTLQDGSKLSLQKASLQDAILTKMRESVVLVIPQENRKNWIYDIISIDG